MVQNLNRIVQKMKYCRGTFSGYKLQLCVEKCWVLGHCCTFEGRIPDESKVAVIRNWGPCRNLSAVCTFLGTAGVLWIFIKNFVHTAHHLVKLTSKDIGFEWGKKQDKAQEDLKEVVISSHVLRPLDYMSDAPVILAVDTSYIAVGFFLCQCSQANIRKCIYNRFGSITLNEWEAHFSQPKL
jgi:RNase H-like domain found in reverse transcriptase